MVIPAAVTPFSDSGAVDLRQYARLLSWFVENGCDAVVVAGTTGEGPSLSGPEKRDMIRFAAAFESRLPCILGIATNSVTEAKWLCRHAADAGAVSVLVMPPVFFGETGLDGQSRWFESILEASELPVLLYNFPKRVGFKLSTSLLQTFREHPKFRGVKDSSAEEANLSEYKKVLPHAELFVGDETLLFKSLEEGWSGTISGAANVLALWLKAIDQEFPHLKASAQAKMDLLVKPLGDLRTEPQPQTLKHLLCAMGVLSSAAVRVPLGPVKEPNCATVEALLNGLTLLRN